MAFGSAKIRKIVSKLKIRAIGVSRDDVSGQPDNGEEQADPRVGPKPGLREACLEFLGLQANGAHSFSEKWVKEDSPAMPNLGAVDAALEEMGGTLYFGDRFEHAKTVAALHSLLADNAIAAAMNRGRAMTLEQAVKYALESVIQLAV
jgi:hypothetical protein